MSLTALEPSKSRTTLEMVRDGPDGKIIGYKEIVVGESNLTAKNSTSLLREPGAINHFVKGASSQFPFAPGGLESEVMVDTGTVININDKEIVNLSLNFEDDEILSIPPGFDRGLIFEDGQNRQIRVPTNKLTSLNITDMISHDENELAEFLEPLNETEYIREVLNKELQENIEVVEMMKDEETNKDITDLEDSVDNLLPTRAPPLKGLGTASKASTSAARKRNWAHDIDVNIELSNFEELVPEMAFDYPFELDTFQKQAIYHLESGCSIFVAAHTSAGKTAIAEYAIALSAKHMTRAIYTSPIKALSNQKYGEFKKNFEVGILTGDVQIHPESSCLIMTTEILRSMLYKGADLIRDVEFVIFDERGVVWEEVIIMLPAHVTLILLSATVPNTKEFADWVGYEMSFSLKEIITPKRPVPLEHYIYANKEIYKIVDENGKFLEQGYQEGGGGGGGGARTNFQDKPLWIDLVRLLKKKDYLPVINFVFSKKRCNILAESLSSLDLCNAAEQSKICITIENSLKRLKGTNKDLLQVLKMKSWLKRGIAVHHSGLLPIIKEMVEKLFKDGLVKVLFATETFAMGVNMPARTVVYSGIKKHDGMGLRELNPGEYTQMSGRAGRRNKDHTGIVIILPDRRDKIPEVSSLKNMILGKPTKLESQFRLTYNMILNLLRVKALRVEEMIKRSFSENASQKMLPDQQEEFMKNEKSFSELKKLDCTICNRDINEYYDASTTIVKINHHLLEKIIINPLGLKVLSPGRVIVINSGSYRNVAAVILKSAPAGPKIDKSFWVFMLLDEDTIQSEREGLAPLPVTRLSIPNPSSCTYKIEYLTYRDIGFITNHLINLDIYAIMEKNDQHEISKLMQELLRCATQNRINEYDWSKIKEYNFQLELIEKNKLMNELNSFHCVICPDLIEHYGHIHGERELKARIDDLKHTISDQNLELLPVYEQKIEVLKRLKYIDPNGTLQLKGHVACEINSADELVLTELILENEFKEYEPEEIVAMLSCFVFQEKRANKPNLTPKLEEGVETIKKFGKNIAKECDLNDDDIKINIGLVEVVYEWAKKEMDFKEITELTEVLEGSIVRCITRLDETCREVINAARMIGDSSLSKKMKEAQSSIKRDIITTKSL
ncbi:11037_t:CDS:10, partial [Funneliformis caledonium]